MGTKVNPTGFRLGQTKKWESNWRTNKNEFSNTLHLDLQIKELVLRTLDKHNILLGKIFIREINTEKKVFVIKGTYYLTQSFISSLKKEQRVLQPKLLNTKIENLIQVELKSRLTKFISNCGLTHEIEIDLTNLINLGYNHSLKIINSSEQQIKGPLVKTNYAKDLYLLCHKMLLIKDSTIFGNAIVPLLERTTNHHLVISNIERICTLVFNQYKGINGLRLDFKGRIGGSARSRSKSLILGSLSNQQIDSNVDYSFHEAVTRYGVCSLKIWLC